MKYPAVILIFFALIIPVTANAAGADGDNDGISAADEIAIFRTDHDKKDTDGDGLLDEWETNGITIDGGAGPMFIDLPAMGADPNKPDIFLQIDWMQNVNHSHALNSAAIKKVVDPFAASLYVSPAGSVGINLHVDEGPTSILQFHHRHDLGRIENVCFGVSWGTRSSSFSAVVFDLHQSKAAESMQAQRSADVYVPALVVPIPMIGATEGPACDELAERIRRIATSSPGG